MNHYLLYKMIYGRILEAACAILAMIALVGAGVFRGRAEVWLFWGMTVLFTILRWFVTRRMKALEADCEAIIFQDLHLDK
jgi:hypothetical protein